MQTTIIVKGMDTGQCKAIVRGALEAKEGVQGTEIIERTKRVNIMYDETEITRNELIRTVREQGYEVIR